MNLNFWRKEGTEGPYWDLAVAPKKEPAVPNEVGVLGHYEVDGKDDVWTATFDSTRTFEPPVPIGDTYPSRSAAEEAAQADYDVRQKEPVW